MRICVPTETDEGTGAAISRRFGRAPFFSVVDSVTGEVEVVANRHLHQAQGERDPVSQLSALEPDALVVAGIGGTALGRLAAAGIPTFVTSASTLGHVLSQVRAGGLKEIDPEQAGRGGVDPAHGRVHQA